MSATDDQFIVRENLQPGEPEGDWSRASRSSRCQHIAFHAECEHCVAAEGASTCAVTGKKKFRTPKAADSMCRTIRRRDDTRMHSYRCEHCRFWHIAHNDAYEKSAKGDER